MSYFPDNYDSGWDVFYILFHFWHLILKNRHVSHLFLPWRCVKNKRQTCRFFKIRCQKWNKIMIQSHLEAPLSKKKRNIKLVLMTVSLSAIRLSLRIQGQSNKLGIFEIRKNWTKIMLRPKIPWPFIQDMRNHVISYRRY